MPRTIRLKTQNKKTKIQQRLSRVKVLQKNPKIVLKQVGAKGETGAQGPQGIPGVGLPTGGLTDQMVAKASNADHDYKFVTPNEIADKTFVQDFTVSSIVNVNHNLNKYPAVSVIDSAGDGVEGEVYYVNTTQLVVSFAYPFSGRVTCN